MPGRRTAGLALMLACVLGPATAVQGSPTPIIVPAGFRLLATHGFEINAMAIDGTPRQHPDGLILFVHRRHESVLYFDTEGVAVTESDVNADLGPLGSIHVQFVPTGEIGEEESACARSPVRFEAGRFEGQIEFEGSAGTPRRRRPVRLR